MNRLAITSLFSLISLAREQGEHKSLAQPMMLHDEMVHKFDQDIQKLVSSTPGFSRLGKLKIWTNFPDLTFLPEVSVCAIPGGLCGYISPALPVLSV